jgi:predicted transposase YdaD
LAKIQAAELVGEQRGRQAGLIEGEQQGEVKGQQELVLRQLTRRLGNVSVELETRVKALPLLQLEELGEALLDFSQIGDLVAWLDLVDAASGSEDRS